MYVHTYLILRRCPQFAADSPSIFSLLGVLKAQPHDDAELQLHFFPRTASFVVSFLLVFFFPREKVKFRATVEPVSAWLGYDLDSSDDLELPTQ